MANMWEAVFADVGVSVIAILNSMRTLEIRNRKKFIIYEKTANDNFIICRFFIENWKNQVYNRENVIERAVDFAENSQILTKNDS